MDDERHIVRLIQVNLERQGYHVTCAFGGRDAIDRLEGGRFDLVILDLAMPGIAGCEVFLWIREQEEHRDTLVWLLASEQEAEAAGCEDAKADWYSAKPFHPINWWR